MSRRLTPRQRRVFEVIAELMDARNQPPTLAEIGHALDGRSPQAVRPHVVALARKGYVAYGRHEPRSLRLLRPVDEREPGPGIVRLPIVGVVAAGMPIEKHDVHDEHILLEAGWAQSPDNFVLRVRGNSMIGDGILNGDLVVVRPAERAENGETVVAMLADGSVTLKRFYQERGYVRLQPANDQLEPIVVPSVAIQGKVIAVLRRLGA